MFDWRQWCPQCDQGWLLVHKHTTSGKPFLLCQECDSAWESPSIVINHGENYDFGQHHDGYDWADVERATAADILKAGWDRYGFQVDPRAD